jgi:integrase
MLSHENDKRLPDSALFLTEMGTAVDPDNFKGRVFKKDLKASGLREIRIHDLRHTALTLMVKKGALLPVNSKDRRPQGYQDHNEIRARDG